MEKIGPNKKKPDVLSVVCMFFSLYVVQAILQKRLVLCENMQEL